MSTTYTAVPANGANPGSAAITIPADGDPDNAATFNAGLQKLADYIANMGALGRVRSGAILRLSWAIPTSSQTGTFGATNSLVTLSPPSGANTVIATIGTDVTATVSPYKLTANVTGMYRVWFTRTFFNASGGAISFSFQKNGLATTITDGDQGQLPTSAGPGTAMFESYLQLTAGDFIQAAFFGTSGQAYSLQPVTALSTAAHFFGMERIA